MSLVSVIVPVYNAAQFLDECIESILNQTHSDIELLLVDDGSEDNSSEICLNYQESDSRVKYINQGHNGVSTARNIGLEHSKGKYICFIDSDDYIETDYIEVLYNKIEKEQTGIVYCNYKLMHGDKELKKKARLSNGNYTFDQVADILIDDGTITGILFGSVCFAIYNSEIIKKNNLGFVPGLKRNEDGLFNLCYLQKAGSFSVIDYDGYLYRKWKTKKKTNMEWDYELDKATHEIKEHCSDFPDLEKQLKRREVSVVFWNAIKVDNVKGNPFSISKKLKKYLSDHPIEDAYTYLNHEKLNSQKKTLVKALKNKQSLRFVLIMKYAYPILKKIIKR